MTDDELDIFEFVPEEDEVYSDNNKYVREDDTYSDTGFLPEDDERINRGIVPRADEDSSMMNPEVLGETMLDMANVAHQAATLNWSDEIAGTLASGFSGGSREDAQRAYYKTRDAIRESVKRSRERSPLATTAVDIGAGAFERLSPVGNVALGAIAGAGASESDNYKGVIRDSIIGAGLSLGGEAGGKALRSVGNKLFGRPRRIRQETLGARAADLQDRGYSNRIDVDTDLDSVEFYDNYGKPIRFSVTKGKFEPDPKRTKIPRGETEITQLRNDADKALAKISDRFDSLVMQHNNKVGGFSFNDIFNSPELSEAGYELMTPNIANDAIGKQTRNMLVQIRNTTFKDGLNAKSANLEKLIEIKRSLQKMGDFTDSGDFTTPTEKKYVAQKLSTAINKYISRVVGEAGGNAKKMEEYNRLMSRLMTQSTDLTRRDANTTSNLNFFSKMLFPTESAALAKHGESLANTPAFGLERAKIGQMLDDTLDETPVRYKNIIKRVAKQAPMRAITPHVSQNSNRGPLDRYTSIPEMIIKTKIPRDSIGIIENKDFVLEKVRMQMPMMYNNIKDIIEKEPHKIQETLPLIVEAAPHLFESDQYNRVDGKFTNPEDKSRAIEDTILRDDISNSDRVSVISNISQKGIM